MSDLITNNSVVNSGEGIKNLKQVLKDWKATTKIDVVKMLAFLSVVGNDTTVKSIKEKCYSFLQDRCADCENAVDPESGIEVTRVDRNVNIFNPSAEVDKLNEQMVKLKEKIKKAQDKAGIAHTETNSYYKVKL